MERRLSTIREEMRWRPLRGAITSEELVEKSIRSLLARTCISAQNSISSLSSSDMSLRSMTEELFVISRTLASSLCIQRGPFTRRSSI